VVLESVDASGPKEVKSKTVAKEGLKVVWQVTFRTGFGAGGRRVEAGAHYDFDATLKQTDKGWLIDNC
jgi:hypothetical protein